MKTLQSLYCDFRAAETHYHRELRALLEPGMRVQWSHRGYNQFGRVSKWLGGSRLVVENMHTGSMVTIYAERIERISHD